MTPGRLDNIRLYRLGEDYALGDDTGHLLATYTHGSYRYYHQP